ncbi:tripartite motif-containing protein 43B-like protein [Cricetulus griseus]|nr:tripartite motif-containing protein 43B-like protein [Cricetulus griseus]
MGEDPRKSGESRGREENGNSVDRTLDSAGRNDQDRVSRTWYPVPSEEEEQCMEYMENEGQCVVDTLRESEAMMLLESNEEMYQQLMAMSQKPYLALLQGLDDMFQMHESMQLSMPQALKSELQALPINGLTESFQSFQAHILFEYSQAPLQDVMS